MVQRKAAKVHAFGLQSAVRNVHSAAISSADLS
jgi:hypothetical protein